MDETPTFEVKMIAGREMVYCTLGEHVGAARVFSKGVQDACDRAEVQARSKLEAATQES